MKRELFKGFRETVRNANASSDVWYMGYLWMDMTETQTRQIGKVLASHPDVQPVIKIGKGTWYRLPSGIEIRNVD